MPRKVSIVLDDDLYMKILDYATKTGIKKVSTAIRALVVRGLREEELEVSSQRLEKYVEEILNAMKKIKEGEK